MNIAISQFGIEFLRSAADLLARGADRPGVGLTESTYLYLCTEAGLGSLRNNVAMQSRCGVAVRLCEPVELTRRYPWLNAGDLEAGALTSCGEGWFDGYRLLMALRGKARDLGVPYLASRVENLMMTADHRVGGAVLADGSRLTCDYFVNATGTWARQVTALAGIDIPVVPRKRCVFVFESPFAIPDCPLVIDPSGLWFRPEGRHFICGMPPHPDLDVAVDDFTVDHSIFAERIWPLLASRVPAFEAVRLRHCWAGHYDYNVFDQNAIVGPHPDVPNFLLANGFSGHGLQQAPAIGRGICEHIVFGEYRSLDLTPLSFERLGKNEPLLEKNVI